MGTTQLPNSGRRRALDARIKCAILPIRVPRVYLNWANPVFLPFFPFNRVNNLRVFNVAFSSIPTAPTKYLQIAGFFIPLVPKMRFVPNWGGHLGEARWEDSVHASKPERKCKGAGKVD
jgi:hypothetical protein